jgi:bacterioferritin
MPHFVKDVEDLRHRAEQKMEDGAVTLSYKGDVDKAIEILNEALATEIVCVLRYMHHYFMATGVHGRGVADEFKEHADAEREHADMLAERIQQLGGKPDFNPKNLLQRSVSQYVEGETLADMIREDLIAERIVIEVYQEMIRFFGNNDPTTRVILEKLLHDEEEHADDLSDLLYIVNPETAQTEGQDPGTEPLRIREGKRTTQEIAEKRNRATQSSNARHAAGQDAREAQRRTMQAEPGSEEAHKRDRDRILNELRWMGKNKKKPAA